MINNFLKRKIFVFIIIFFSIIFVNTVFAVDLSTSLDQTREGAGFETATDTTTSEQIGSIISYALSFLGVIFVVLLIYAGFLWMTAQGESDQVDKAKDIMRNSIIGLIIVLSAVVITQVVLDILMNK